jgi:hypothetical protein
MASACICFIVLSKIPSAPIDLLFTDETIIILAQESFLGARMSGSTFYD